MKRFMDETECLVSEHISWKDIIDVFHTQIKTDIKIRLNEVGGSMYSLTTSHSFDAAHFLLRIKHPGTPINLLGKDILHQETSA